MCWKLLYFFTEDSLGKSVTFIFSSVIYRPDDTGDFQQLKLFHVTLWICSLRISAVADCDISSVLIRHKVFYKFNYKWTYLDQWNLYIVICAIKCETISVSVPLKSTVLLVRKSVESDSHFYTVTIVISHIGPCHAHILWVLSLLFKSEKVPYLQFITASQVGKFLTFQHFTTFNSFVDP
jgi:hypothetical protein